MKSFLKNNSLHLVFFAILIGTLALGQLQKLPLSFGAAIYAHDCIIVVWLLTTGLLRQSFQLPWKKYLTSPSLWLGAWILLITGISAVNSHQVVPLLYMLRLGTYSVFVIVLAHSQTLKSKDLVQGTLAIGLLLAVFGVIQFAIVPDLRLLNWIGFDGHYYRLTSTFLDPNFAGIALVLTFLFIQLFVYQKKIRLSQWQNLGVSLLLFGSIAATYSRATYLSVGLVGLFLYLQKKLEKKTLITIYGVSLLFAVGVWWLLPKPGGDGVKLTRTTSIDARVTSNYSSIVDLSPAAWVFGNGIYTQAPKTQDFLGAAVPNHARVPDNIFVLLLTSGGVIGLALGVLALREWYSKLVTWHPFAPALLIALVTHAQFNNSFFEPTLFLYLGLGLVALQKPTTK